MVNIFAATPSTMPSVLNSTAGAAMALANPVMGTRVPAPACLAMSSYTLSPVSRADSATSDMDAAVDASLFSKPNAKYPLMASCPNTQISPPIQKAFRQSRISGERGERWAASF